MVVRIETEDGIVGYAPGAASEENARKIKNEIAPLLTGQKIIWIQCSVILFVVENKTICKSISQIIWRKQLNFNTRSAATVAL